jgi:peptide/nickel transport system permease protein
MGTDPLGRDVFSRLLHGAWPVALAGIVPVAIAMLVGMPLGLCAGYATRHPAMSWTSPS